MFVPGTVLAIETDLSIMMKMSTSIKALEEQTRRNIEMFREAMRMFTPFPAGQHETGAAEPPRAEADDKTGDLAELKEQIAAMQRKIDSMS